MPTAWDTIPNKVPKIAICIPYNSDWKPEWVERTYGPLRYIPTSWCNKLVFFCKVPSLPVARDILVNQAIQSNCDYLLFMDNDHVFETPTDPNEALNLLYHCMNKSNDKNAENYKDARIVSGLYRAKQKSGFNWAMWMKYGNKTFTPIKEWTGNWIKIDVTGLGCCLIDMVVFKDIPKPWFYWEEGDGMSEDFYFYQHAKTFGYDTHIFTDVKLSHLGNLKVMTDGTITTADL